MATLTPAFPVLRADLYDQFSTKLNIKLDKLEEHLEDSNYIRNKVNNLSKSILDSARLGKHNIQLLVLSDFTQEILAKLKENFPDTQFLVSTSTKKNTNLIKAFWT